MTNGLEQYFERVYVCVCLRLDKTGSVGTGETVLPFLRGGLWHPWHRAAVKDRVSYIGELREQ